MSQIYICADLHLGHRNLAFKRGFRSVEQHDDFIIQNWNSVVTKRDTVIILGDLTMETKAHYHLLDKLNGIKRVVGGNHDKAKYVPDLLNHVRSFTGMWKYKSGIILTHCPIHTSQMRRFGMNIHGHIHERTIKDYRYRNVSLEQIDYTPKLIKEVMEEYEADKRKPLNRLKRFFRRLL